MAFIGFFYAGHQLRETAELMLSMAVMSTMLTRQQICISQWEHDERGIGALLPVRYATELLVREAQSFHCGLDGLLHVLRNQRMRYATLRDYIDPILRDRLDWLQGAKHMSLWDVQTQSYAALSERLRTYYTHCLFALPSASNHPLRVALLPELSTAVVVLNQRTSDLENALTSLQTYAISEQTKVVFVIVDYDSTLRMNAASIKRKYRLKQPLFVLPYCAAVRDACNERALVHWLLERVERNTHLRKSEEAPFMRALRELCTTIIHKEDVG